MGRGEDRGGTRTMPCYGPSRERGISEVVDAPYVDLYLEFITRVAKSLHVPFIEKKRVQSWER